MDFEMTGITSGVGHNQVLQGLNGGVHKVPAVGNGADNEDQTMAGESADGKGPPTASTEMEVDTSDENKGQETSPAQKRPPQSSMVTPMISRHIAINEAHLTHINSDSNLSKVLRTPVHAAGVMGKHLCL